MPLHHRRRGHKGLLKGLLALLKKRRKAQANAGRGGHLLSRGRLRKPRIRHTRFRIKALRYRPLRYRIKVYRQPKPPNEMPDIIAAIKGGFKP